LKLHSLANKKKKTDNVYDRKSFKMAHWLRVNKSKVLIVNRGNDDLVTQQFNMLKLEPAALLGVTFFDLEQGSGCPQGKLSALHIQNSSILWMWVLLYPLQHRRKSRIIDCSCKFNI